MLFWNRSTSYSFASVSGIGNSPCDVGFSSPVSSDNQHDLAWARYKFTFDMPNDIPDISFSLNLIDANWSGNYTPHDIWICYDCSLKTINRKIGQGGTYSTLIENSIWEIYGFSQPYQSALQPTPPQNFSCTNPTQIKKHPHFTWNAPDWPGVQKGKDDLTVYYKIFRDNNIIASNITSNSFTDEDVYLYPGAPIYTYYVKAYLSHSPDSDPSNAVTINNDWKNNSDGDESNLPIFCYPNPFNPETKISYTLQNESRVTLSIYNIAGQKVTTLVEERQSVGIHSVVFNGKNLPAGIYLVRLQVGGENYLQKVLLVK